MRWKSEINLEIDRPDRQLAAPKRLNRILAITNVLIMATPDIHSTIVPKSAKEFFVSNVVEKNRDPVMGMSVQKTGVRPRTERGRPTINNF